jgi:hypothetical protein
MGLFKNAQMQGAQEPEREAYAPYTLSVTVSSATQ